MSQSDYPLIISFCTPTWEYEKYMWEMADKVDELGLDRHFTTRPDTGSWIGNTRLKPRFILDTLLSHSRPVLWIDADGVLVKTPDFLKGSQEYDFAAKRKPIHRAKMWHVGTLYFNFTPSAIAFLRDWCALTEASPKDDSDEMVLDNLWESTCDSVMNLLVADLPEEYFQMLNSEHPDPLRHTVIAHRASKGESKLEYHERMKNEH